MAALLVHYKREYSGVAQLGIEALELKIRGYSGADIARLYHNEPNHVGAWISRAKAKLKRMEPSVIFVVELLKKAGLIRKRNID